MKPIYYYHSLAWILKRLHLPYLFLLSLFSLILLFISFLLLVFLNGSSLFFPLPVYEAYQGVSALRLASFLPWFSPCISLYFSICSDLNWLQLCLLLISKDVLLDDQHRSFFSRWRPLLRDLQNHSLFGTSGSDHISSNSLNLFWGELCSL